MKFSGKMWLMIILNVTKKQGFPLSLENIFLNKLSPPTLFRVKLTYMYLNAGDKVRECYSILKLMLQAHLHDGSSTAYFVKNVSVKRSN